MTKIRRKAPPRGKQPVRPVKPLVDKYMASFGVRDPALSKPEKQPSAIELLRLVPGSMK